MPGLELEVEALGEAGTVATRWARVIQSDPLRQGFPALEVVGQMEAAIAGEFRHASLEVQELVEEGRVHELRMVAGHLAR